MKKKILNVIVVSIVITMFFACGQRKAKEETTKELATIQSYGNTYVINSFTVDTDEKGYTIVKVAGSGFSTLQIINDNFVFPIHCSFISIIGAEHVFSRFYNPTDTTAIYYFETPSIPKTVSFYPRANREEKYSFNWE